MTVIASTQPAPNRSPFGLLSGHLQFRLLFLGTTLAQLAFGMMNVAQGVVAFDLTGKNSAVGFVALGQGLAMLVVGPLGGTLSDRVSKRRLLLTTQTTIGSMYAIIAALIITGTITIWVLATATLVLGCMYAVMGPTRQAWLGDMLEGPELITGIALQQLMQNATRIVGPLVAGALIATHGIGAGGTYTTMVAIFVIVVAVLTLTEPTPPRPRDRHSSVLGDLSAGLNYIRRSPDVRLLAVVFVGVVMSGFSYQTIMPGFLENQLGHPASQLGWVYGAAAIGGVVTTLTLTGRKPVRSIRLMFVFGMALPASLGLLAVAPSFGTALAGAALVGASSSGFQMLNNINLMQRTSPNFLGRVMAVTLMAFGVQAIVAYPIGVFADHSGERVTMGLLGGVCLVVVTVGFALSRVGTTAARFAEDDSRPPRGVEL